MKHLILLIAFIPILASADDAPCSAWKNPIASDMRILESQLTADTATKAQAFLAKHGQKGNDEFEFGRENSRKTIRGYELKRAAESGSKEELTVFCEWLTKEGFWHD
jgi:hypothetical protein